MPGRGSQKRRRRDWEKRQKEKAERARRAAKEARRATARRVYASFMSKAQPLFTTLIGLGGYGYPNTGPNDPEDPYLAAVVGAEYADPTAPPGMFKEDLDFYFDPEKRFELSQYVLRREGVEGLKNEVYQTLFPMSVAAAAGGCPSGMYNSTGGCIPYYE